MLSPRPFISYYRVRESFEVVHSERWRGLPDVAFRSFPWKRLWREKNAHIELFSFLSMRPCWEWLYSMIYQSIYIFFFICSKARSEGTREAEDSNKYKALSSWPIFGRINCQNTVNHTDGLRCRCEKRKILLRNEKLRVWKNKSLLSFYEGDLNSSNTPSTERNFIWNSTSRRRPGAWCNGLTKGNYLKNHQS